MKQIRKTVKYLVLALVLLVVFTLVHSLFFPAVAWLEDRNPDITAFQAYRMKQWEKAGRDVSMDKSWVPLSKISTYLKQAVIISEDDKFGRHGGFDWEAIRKALGTNWKRRRLSFGGSTITQQLAKNLFLSPSRNPLRKMREAVLTWRLERALSKDRILEIYLNVIEWGEGIFGCEAAAHRYFQTPASDLNPEQAAWLAAVIPSPVRYGRLGMSPYLKTRTAEILAVMRKRGIIE